MSIIDPVTRELVDLKSNRGFEILKNYLENFVSQEGGRKTTGMNVNSSISPVKDPSISPISPVKESPFHRIELKPSISSKENIANKEKIAIKEKIGDIKVSKENFETWNVVNTMQNAIIINLLNNGLEIDEIKNEFKKFQTIDMSKGMTGSGYYFDNSDIKSRSLLTLLDHWHDFASENRARLASDNKRSLSDYINNYINLLNFFNFKTNPTQDDISNGLIHSLNSKINGSRSNVTPPLSNVFIADDIYETLSRNQKNELINKEKFNNFNREDGYDYEKLVGVGRSDIENLSFWVLCKYAAVKNHNLKPICRRLDVLYDVQTNNDRLNWFFSPDNVGSDLNFGNWSSTMLQFLKNIDDGFKALTQLSSYLSNGSSPKNDVLDLILSKTKKAMAYFKNVLFTPPERLGRNGIEYYFREKFVTRKNGKEVVNLVTIKHLERFLVSLELRYYMKKADVGNPYLIVDTLPARIDNSVLRYLDFLEKEYIALEINSYISFIDSSSASSIIYPLEPNKLIETTENNWLPDPSPVVPLLRDLQTNTYLENDINEFIDFNNKFYSNNPEVGVNFNNVNNVFRARSFINYVDQSLSEKYRKIMLDGFWFQLENPTGAHSNYNLYYNKELMKYLYNRKPPLLPLSKDIENIITTEDNWINLTYRFTTTTLVTVPFAQSLIRIITILRDTIFTDPIDYGTTRASIQIYHGEFLNMLAEGTIFEAPELESLFSDWIEFKPPAVVNNWKYFIKRLFTNIRDKIYTGGEISPEQYFEFYNGLIRKIRDEKKLGDHNQCYQANNEGLRLATIDRPLFAQSILTETKSVLCRNNSNGLLLFEPRPSEYINVTGGIFDFINKMKEIDRLIPIYLIKRFIEENIFNNKEFYNLKTITNYEIVYRLIDKISLEKIEASKNLVLFAKDSLIILQIKNFYNTMPLKKLSNLIKSSLPYLKVTTSLNESSSLEDLNNINIRLIGKINDIISDPKFIASLSDESENYQRHKLRKRSFITDDDIKDDIVDNIIENVDDDIIKNNKVTRILKLRNRIVKVVNEVSDLKKEITTILKKLIPKRKSSRGRRMESRGRRSRSRSRSISRR